MNESYVFLVVVLALLSIVFFLSKRLVRTSEQMERFASRCLTHTCAFNEDQRSFMRDRYDAEIGKAVVQGSRPNLPPLPSQPQPDPEDIEGMISTPIPYEG